MAGRPPISEEIARFLESGLAIVVATRSADLQPDGAAAWAARVSDDRTRLTVFLYEKAATRLRTNLESTREIAVVFDLPTSHRACQVKGAYLSSRPARPEERDDVERQVEGFVSDLEAIGISRAMTAAWTPWPCTAVEMEVRELFEQTPGPGTGERLK